VLRTRVISRGDRVRCGKYKLHSKFASAANFISGNTYVFVVIPEVGAGPLNIVVRVLELRWLRSLEVQPRQCILNGEMILSHASEPYNSNLHLSGYNEEIFRVNLKVLEHAIVQFSPQKSLAFLLDPDRTRKSTSLFECELISRFEIAMGTALSENYQNAIGMVKGLGFGLTPSGDDFISGFLVAMNVCQQVFKTDLSQPILSVWRAAQGRNDLVNAFLACAARGQVSEKFKNMIYSLFFSREEEVVRDTRRLLTVGATSGADQTVGFFTGMKRFSI